MQDVIAPISIMSGVTNVVCGESHTLFLNTSNNQSSVLVTGKNNVLI
jgi:hypothetical protein